jgi:hypothetical protein
MIKDPLLALQRWYLEHCNDDWEHQYGVKFETIDNPGWSMEIDLRGTELSGKEFAEIKLDRSQADWIVCRVREGKFEGFGGAENLKEIIEVFLSWAEEETRGSTQSDVDV